MTTQELTREVVDIKSKVSGMDEKMADACNRLNAVEREVKEQGKLLQSIDRLAMGLTRLDEKMTDLSGKIDVFGNRISLIELKPAQKWETITWEILKYLVIAAVGFAVAELIGGI